MAENQMSKEQMDKIEKLMNDEELNKELMMFHLGASSVQDAYRKGFMTGFLATTTIYVVGQLINYFM